MALLDNSSMYCNMMNSSYQSLLHANTAHQNSQRLLAESHWNNAVIEDVRVARMVPSHRHEEGPGSPEGSMSPNAHQTQLYNTEHLIKNENHVSFKPYNSSPESRSDKVIFSILVVD